MKGKPRGRNGGRKVTNPTRTYTVRLPIAKYDELKAKIKELIKAS